MLTKNHSIQGQADTAEHVNDFPDKASPQVSKVAAECGAQRSKSSWDEVDPEGQSDLTSTQEDVTGIATLESLQGKEILVTMAVWRSGQNSTACGSTAVAEARSMAKDEDYLSAISYMLAENLRLGKKK